MDTELAATFDCFARFYDEDYRYYDADVDAILRLADEMAGPVLELGCGTGRLLLPLTHNGHEVTGVDISPGLLALAEEKLAAHAGGDRVKLVQGDLRDAPLPRNDYAFAFCTSNTLMHLNTPEDQLAALQHTARHLRPGGLLFIDCFHPDLARLIEVDGVMELADQWLREDGAEVLKWSVRQLDLAEQLQDTLFVYEEIDRLGGVRRTSCPFTLRFLWRNELELMLERVGLTVETIWGDFEGAPYTSRSEHLIALATKPAGEGAAASADAP